MCSREDEKQSYLASALDSYRNTQFLNLDRNVEDILKKAFCLSDAIIENTDGTIHGAVVDEKKFVCFFLFFYLT